MSEELDLTFPTSITNMALAHAATALGKMIKEEVIVHDFTVNPPDWEWEVAEGEFFVLRTDVKGDFAGEVYLVVVPEDEPKISDILLPGSLVGQPEMREAILLEVDNILTASVVTKYSEVLKKQVIGDVPEAQRYSAASLSEYFTNKASSESYVFNFSSQLITFQTELKLYFGGFFNQRFVEDVLEATKPEYHQREADNGESGSYISKTTKGLFRKILPW